MQIPEEREKIPRRPPIEILVISRNLPPLTGGMERLLINAVTQLSQDHHVEVIGPSGCTAHLPANCKVREAVGRGATAYLVSAAALAIYSALRQRPDTILAGSGLTAPIAWGVSLLRRAPYAVMVHGLDVVVAHKLYQLLFVPALRSADLVIANSRNTTRLAEAAGVPAGAISLLHPGVAYPAPKSEGFRARHGLNGVPLLLAVGRIVPRKGLAAFVCNAMPAILKDVPGVRLAIVGAEPTHALYRTDAELDAIRDAISHNELQRHVVLCGEIADSELHAAYAESDALIFPVLDLPGDVEGFGMVSVEAAAHGLPTFGFRSGGLADAVEDGLTGVLVQAGDYRALAQCISLYLAHGDPDRFGAACRTHAERHAWPRYGERLGQMLCDLAGTRTADREYQDCYSQLHPEVSDPVSRNRKATTAIKVLEHYLGRGLEGQRVLDVGGSSGIMAARLAAEGARVTVIDIDASAIELARQRPQTPNLEFSIGDAMSLEIPDCSVDIVLCCHVYEHVPDANRMMREIHRVLRPGGCCYFAAGNRLAWREPHYDLPLLSVIPRWLANCYLRLTRRGDRYHEKHRFYPGLRRLASGFQIHDATALIIKNPERYAADYLLRPGSVLQALSLLAIQYFPWISPGYIWVLEKPRTQGRPVEAHGVSDQSTSHRS